jgi:hypothetical protein
MAKKSKIDVSRIKIFSRKGILGRPVTMIRFVKEIRPGVKYEKESVFRVWK